MATKINLNQPKNQIVKQLNLMHAVDIANELYELNEEERIELIHILPIDMVDNVFLELEEDEIVDFFSHLDDVRRRRLLTDLSAHDLKLLFELLEKEESVRLLSFLSTDKKVVIEKLMLYDETKAASMMRDNYIVLKKDYNISNAMKEVINEVKDTDLIDTIFIVDNDELYGLIYLKDLIIARKNDSLESIINTDIKVINDEASLSDAINKISNYDIKVLPVVNSNNHLVGIITADDVLEEIALDHESHVDKFVAMGDFDEDSSPFVRAYQRLPWLLVSIVLNLVIAMFLSIFSGTIEMISALILFQPLILGMAGNIGTQAIAVTILKIHKNETKDFSQHIKKEVLIGVVNAIIVGVFGFLLSWGFLSFSSFDVGSVNLILLSFVIALSLALSMFLSAMFGVFIPIILTKLKVDPAAASGPVISTINDLVALLIYFGLATIIIIPLIS